MEERGKNWMSLTRRLLILTPFFLFLFLFYIIPLLFLIGNVNQNDFISVLSDDYIHRLFYGTLAQAVLSTLITLILSLPVAFFLAKYSFKGKRVLEYVLLTTFFVPGFTIAEGLIVLLGEKGIINSLLSQLLATGEPVVKILYSIWAVVLAHVIYYVPLATLILEQGFSSVNQDLVDAARVFSGSTLRVFKTVYLNFLTPYMGAASLLVFAFSFITYSTPMLVGGRFTTLEVEIYATKFKPVSSSIALLQLLLTLLVSIIIILFREKYYAPFSTSRPVEEPVSRLFSSPSGILLATYVAFIYVFELTPVAIPVISPFLETGRSFPGLFKELYDFKFGFGLSFNEVLFQSLSIALIVSAVSTLLSVAIVWSSKLSGGILEKIVSILMALPLTMSRSSLALGILLSYGFGVTRLYGSWILMTIGQSAVVVPLAARIIEASWSRVVKEYREAADAHGATAFFRLVRVEMPLIMPAVVASLLMAFSSSLSDFTFSTFFSTLNLMTLPVAVNLLIDYRRLNLALALTSLLTMLVIIVETAGSQFSKERLRLI
ncbi:MAG: ABC transporter permease subunit [Thermoproteota archaeon]